jgi:predicted CXXCH cytochrome family protein
MARLRLILQLAVGVTATLVLVSFLEVGADRSVFSRGRLSRGHRETACARCHTGAGFSDDDACVRCHREDRTAPAREFVRTRCVECHREHRAGRPMPRERMRAICLRCHGTAEVTAGGTRSGPLLEFHPGHR